MDVYKVVRYRMIQSKCLGILPELFRIH